MSVALVGLGRLSCFRGKAHVVAGFIASLKRARVIWEEETSMEKNASLRLA